MDCVCIGRSSVTPSPHEVLSLLNPGAVVDAEGVRCPATSRALSNEAFDGPAQLGEVLAGTAVAGHVVNAVFHVVRQEDFGHALGGRADGGHLDEDFSAGAALPDHALDGPDVAFNPGQPRDDLSCLGVPGHGVPPISPPGGYQYCTRGPAAGNRESPRWRRGWTPDNRQLRGDQDGYSGDQTV